VRDDKEQTMVPIADEVFNAVLRGDLSAVEEGVKLALEAKMDAAQLLSRGLIAPMDEVGRRFENGEYYVPEMLVAARAMKGGLDILRPFLVQEKVALLGKVVIGTVMGDLHDIGKNLVSMMLEGAGFEIVDLGTDVPPERFATVAREQGAALVGMSALLTTTMQGMASVIEALEDVGIRDQVGVMIGGAPVTDAYAKQIGADGYAADASKAVLLAKSLLRSAERL
jgi:5-methyltetrahydrofolate--homocysteine methyltransferase